MPESRGNQVSVACTQFAAGSWDSSVNENRAEELVREAAGKGANIILLQVTCLSSTTGATLGMCLELFQTPYFCQDQKQELFKLAQPFDDHPMLQRFSRLAAELNVVLPVSYFERANNSFFNSIAVYDADGSLLGHYRKTHIPDGDGYQEKFYFNPGDTGFRIFKTKFCTIGIAVCWDQWFPESARALALQGAEVLFYPTAIGSEPQDSKLNSYPHWCRVMQGHAGANLTPLVASNRVGLEKMSRSEITFYGGSFIAGPTGEVHAQIGCKTECSHGSIDPEPERVEGVAVVSFDLEAIRWQRASWGLFRDRRPDMYGPLMTSDGSMRPPACR